MSSTAKKGEGVHNSYKEEAKKGCDVLFRVKIKGRSILVDDIPLHMSLKIFSSPKEYDLDELKAYVKKHNICAPDPKTLTFKPIIFTAETSGLDYYMLKIEGLPPKYKALYEHYDDVGNVYKNFMTHVTIDKKLYDDIKQNGIKPEDVEFGPLMIEHGSNSAIHTFEKSENVNKSDYGPKKLDLYSHADNARRKADRTGEIIHIGPNKAIHAAGPTASERAEHQARLDKQKSKKNPVKVYSRKERKKLASKMGVLAASEDMEKGIKHAVAGLAAVGAMAGSPKAQAPKPVASRSIASVPQNTYNSKRMLNAIASVESQHGKYQEHKTTHNGEHAIGKYGLLPSTIRDTIHMNRDLKSHNKAMNLRGDDMRRYVEDNPGLEDQIAQKHLTRLEHHFGQDPETIGYSWLNGVAGTYKAKKQNTDIKNHWHAKKIRAAYDKEK